MCKFRKYCITIPSEQLESANSIIERYYYQGAIDSISVGHQLIDYTCQIWVGCSSDDLESIKTELQKNDIKLL
mgnify:CR=1 FL=1